MAIRILIADDHGVVAEGLKHLVEARPSAISARGSPTS